MPKIINFTKDELCPTFGTTKQEVNVYNIDTPTLAVGSEISKSVNNLTQLMANRKFGIVQSGSNYHITTGNDGRVTAMQLCTSSGDETLPACPVCVMFSESLPSAPSAYLGNIRGVDDDYRYEPRVSCWAIDRSNVFNKLKIDLYIDNKLVMTTEGRSTAADIVQAHGGDPNELYNFVFHLGFEFWWQDGSQKDVKVCFHGTKTQLNFDDPNKTTIGYNGGGSGTCLMYREDVVLPSFDGTVNYVPSVDMAAAGLSSVPYANLYTFIRTPTHQIGLSDDMGFALDFVGEMSDTVSYFTQRDSGNQGYQIDPYVGNNIMKDGVLVSEVVDILTNQRGYTTLEPTRPWNGLPQGVYEVEMMNRGTYSPGANFGGRPTSDSWNQETKTLVSTADLYQFAFVDSAGQKVRADSSTNIQKIRVIDTNVFEFETTLNLSIDFLSGLQNNPRLGFYAFYSFNIFKKCKYYTGTAPFTDDASIFEVDLTVLSNTEYTDNRSKYHGITATEKWVGIFNPDESKGIAMVWAQKHRMGASIHVENKTLTANGGGGVVMYLSPFRQRPDIYPNESVTDKVYLVMGSVAEIRAFAYKLNGYPCA
jgi:hypothetical protein